MGLTERHWFENEDVPENYEWDLEDVVYNSRTNKKYDDGIVRCKDCKYGKQLFLGYISCQISDENESECHTSHKPEWFCADGERR